MGPLKKMLIYDERSQYMYENKRNMDKLTARQTDIYGDMTWILQKNSGYDGQFILIDTFGADFVQLSRRKSPSRQSRGKVAAPPGPKDISYGFHPWTQVSTFSDEARTHSPSWLCI
jgi:hypothetical protein